MYAKKTLFPTITLNDHPLEVVHQIKYILGCNFFSKSLLVATHPDHLQESSKNHWHSLPTVLFYRHSLFISPKVVYCSS